MLVDFLFSKGHAVDLILLVIVAEFVFLSSRRPRFGHRPLMIDRVLAFAPGVCLLLALRAALTGSGWPWIAGLLAASFPFHLADLIRRRL
jgi:hypothetical protein